MSFSIPFHPNYEQLRKQAKDLHKACGKGDSSALGQLSVCSLSTIPSIQAHRPTTRSTPHSPTYNSP